MRSTFRTVHLDVNPPTYMRGRINLDGPIPRASSTRCMLVCNAVFNAKGRRITDLPITLDKLI